MLQFVLLPNRSCLHSKLNQMQRIMYRRQLYFQKCCKCCCGFHCYCCGCCCWCCCLTSLAGSVKLPGQFTAKLLDKTVAHKAAGMATTMLVMCATHSLAQQLHRLNRLHLYELYAPHTHIYTRLVHIVCMLIYECVRVSGFHRHHWDWKMLKIAFKCRKIQFIIQQRQTPNTRTMSALGVGPSGRAFRRGRGRGRRFGLVRKRACGWSWGVTLTRTI